MKQSFASGLPREKTVLVRVACSPHFVHVATSEAMMGSGRAGMIAGDVGGGGALLPRDEDAGGVTFSVIVMGVSGADATDGSAFGPCTTDEGTAAPSLADGVAVLEGLAAAGGSFCALIVGSDGAGLTGAAGAAARVSRGRRGIPELPQSTCHSR